METGSWNSWPGQKAPPPRQVFWRSQRSFYQNWGAVAILSLHGVASPVACPLLAALPSAARLCACGSLPGSIATGCATACNVAWAAENGTSFLASKGEPDFCTAAPRVRGVRRGGG